MQTGYNPGIISLYRCEVILIDTCFITSNNQLLVLNSQNQYDYQNQVIELKTDVLVFKNFWIESNRFINKNILLIQNSYIQFNNFTSNQNEGTLYLSNSYNISIIKGNFITNKAQNGGALYFSNIKKHISFESSLFEENSAFSSGGAIYFENINSCQVIFDHITVIKNNKALIGGGLRIVQTDQNPIKLPDKFPFSSNVFQNIAEIYGNDSVSYLSNIIIENADEQSMKLFKFSQNQSDVPSNFQDQYSRYTEMKEFRSGGQISIKVYLTDLHNRHLMYSNDKLINSKYPDEIQSELKNIQISIYGIESNKTLINGQQIINYLSYNSQAFAYEIKNIQILGSLDYQGFFSINSTIFTNSINQKQTLLSIYFRKCKQGEVISQINENIFICNQCLEGTYQIIDPKILYQQSIKEKQDINRCINCPESAVSCKGNEIILKNGFWRSNNQTDEIVACDPIINSCQAQNPSSINYCSAGYLGPICGQCDILGEVWNGNRYSESLLYGACQICSPKLNQWIYFILKAIIFEVYFLYVLEVFIKKFKYQQTCYYLRKLRIIPISSNSISDYSGFYIKIILNYYQLSCLLINQPRIISFNLNFLNDLFGSGSRQLKLEIDCLVSESTIKHLGKILFYTQAQFSIPVVALILIPIILFLHQDSTKVKLRSYHFYLLFHIIFIFFQISQIQYFTKALTCKSIGNQLYNPIDLTIDCYDFSVVKYLYPFSIVVLSFWTLLPLALLRLIKQNQQKLDLCLIIYKYGYFYGELKHKYYYWEFVRIYLKIAIIYIYTLLYSNYQQLTIISIIFLLGYYIKNISQNNPFISTSIQSSEITAYTFILLKIFLLVMQIQIPWSQKFVEIGQITLDYFFFFSYLVIVFCISLSNSTSSPIIFIKNQLLKMIPSKQFHRLINQNKVSFQAYMKWRLVYKKFSRSYKIPKKIKNQDSTKTIKLDRTNKNKRKFGHSRINNVDSFQQFV